MRTFKKTYLPDEIKYNGETYKRTAIKGTKKVRVLVLCKFEKGTTDLRGNLYQPREHFLHN